MAVEVIGMMLIGPGVCGSKLASDEAGTTTTNMKLAVFYMWQT